MEEKRKLPDGWRWVRLGEVCEMNPRRPSDLLRADDDPTAFVPMQAVDETHGAITRRELRPFREVRRGYTYFAENDVLFAKITPCMQNGKHAIARGLLGGVGFGTTEFHVLRPGPAITPEWIHFFIRQPDVLEDAKAYFTGTVGQQRVPEAYLADLEIPLPTVEEQKRVATILNGQMAGVERARAAAEARLEAAKALPAAYLRTLFASPESRQWPKKRLGGISELLPSKSIATNGDAQVEAITTACLSEGGFLSSGIKVARMWAKDVAECIVARGEVLVARSNTPELVGRVAMFPGEPRGVVASDLTIRIRPANGINPEFLTAYLSFLYQTGYWKERAGGASGSMKKITREQIQAEQVPVLPVSDQDRIAVMLNEHMASAERTRKGIEEELDAIDKLPAALLRRAFSGEL